MKTLKEALQARTVFRFAAIVLIRSCSSSSPIGGRASRARQRGQDRAERPPDRGIPVRRAPPTRTGGTDDAFHHAVSDGRRPSRNAAPMGTSRRLEDVPETRINRFNVGTTC
jgi:hypothetical protein